MLVLVATTESQGSDPADYCHTLDGELVTPLLAECSTPDRCGCGRGFPGLATAKATTTAVVVRRPLLTRPMLADAVLDWLERGGWREILADGPFCDEHRPESGRVDDADVDEMLAEIVDEHVEAIVDLCGSFGEGTVLGRDGDWVIERRPARAA